jgi:hypothetical protein
MKTLLMVLLMAGLDAGQADPGVERRGDQTMGFSHQRTTHHFALTADGGTISADVNDAGDASSLAAIRSHLRHIAGAFSAGNFEMPMFIHGRTPPGVETMRRLKGDIVYRAEDTPLGGRLVIQTRNGAAREAIHSFLRFQIQDHATGDPVEGCQHSR